MLHSMAHWIKRIGSTVLALVFTLSTGTAYAQGTIKIMYTDPLSGPFAQVGDQNLQQFKYIIDYINGRGGALGKKFELVSFDNKSQPSEALLALKSATDQNIPVIMQCSGSNIAAALIEGVDKHNERNPTNRIVYVNCGAVATELTNEKCSFWHFRMDAHVGMKAETMVRALPKDVTKVYLLNQDYLFGQSVQRDVKTFLGKLRPDVKIVGDELIPLGKVKDFSPYIQKIVASGADAVITGNWGADMIGLAKAANDGGLKVPFYTYYAASDGVTAAIGAAGIDRIRLVHESHPGNPNAPKALSDYITGYRKLHPQNDVNQPRINTGLNMLAVAIKKAGTVDVDKVAQALEGLEYTNLGGDQVIMRREDHQLQMPIYISVHTNKNIKYDLDASGFGLSLESKVERDKATQPSTCKMQRPS